MRGGRHRTLPYGHRENMTSLQSDGDSSAGHKRKELEDPQVEQRAYNLRPRKDDPITTQRRSELKRHRKQKKTTRDNKHDEEPEPRHEKPEPPKAIASSIQKTMTGVPKRNGQENIKNRTEQILNSDRSAAGRKWRPYFWAPDRGLRSSEIKRVDWTVEKSALQIAPSVVGLQSFTEDTSLFSCSGTVVEFFEGNGLIVTVANLVRCPDTDEVAVNLRIKVFLLNGEALEGRLSYHDFYYNICVVRVRCPAPLPTKSFSSSTTAIDFGISRSRYVVTLGRDRETHALLLRRGKIIPKGRSKFDCEELSVSTCRISKAEVGGPLMDFDGYIIGMNYYHNKETPFIPSFIVLKCLNQFRLFGKVVRPWHGLRVKTLYGDGCSPFERMQTNLRSGVIIERIDEQSSAKASGLKEGDAISRVDGVYFSNAAELGGILLDIGTNYLLKHPNFNQPDADSSEMEICLKFSVRGRGSEKTVVVNKPKFGGLNRWPFL
ncbi:hypothetical protein BAE44_0005159 [Dichanthelium oligosanthes]|uniref:PDZ domain-containing protein n=1 Tax=Dichanthelium oligosanthes TaxID=888268 RepID=A0A1E5W8W7_9POAL|nr:hypothetical protein BAE44_0005159 [Dichanthelium oligosanthes]